MPTTEDKSKFHDKEDRLCKNCVADNRRQLDESIRVRIASASYDRSPFYNYSLSKTQWYWDMHDTQDKSLQCPPEPPVISKLLNSFDYCLNDPCIGIEFITYCTTVQRVPFIHSLMPYIDVFFF